MISTMQIHPDAMMAQAKKGYLAATDVADYLAKKRACPSAAPMKWWGISCFCARSVAAISRICRSTTSKAESDLFEDDIVDSLNLEAIVAARTTYGGTGHEAVRVQPAEAIEASSVMSGI